MKIKVFNFVFLFVINVICIIYLVQTWQEKYTLTFLIKEYYN